MKCNLLDSGINFYPDKDNLSLLKPCCHFTTTNPKKIDFKNIANSFQSQERLYAIKDLEQDTKFPGCETCWKHEDNGYPSMRTRTNTLWKNSEFGKLKYLELNTGNTCNLQCIMCNTQDSLKTKVYRNIIKKYTKQEPNDFTKYARGLRKKDIDEIDYTSLQDLQYIKCTGGETFYTKEYWYFLNKLTEHGLSKNITLINVTNNTIEMDQEKINVLNNFKRVKIFSSVDGIGKLGEAIRAGSFWSVVENNIKQLIELHKEFPNKFSHTEPHTVVQFANVLQLDEIVYWWESISTNAFKNSQYFRILMRPDYYDIRHLDDATKSLITKKYKDIKKLNHVVNYVNSNKQTFDLQTAVCIFSKSCEVNDVDPNVSDVFKVVKHVI